MANPFSLFYPVHYSPLPAHRATVEGRDSRYCPTPEQTINTVGDMNASPLPHLGLCTVITFLLKLVRRNTHKLGVGQ